MSQIIHRESPDKIAISFARAIPNFCPLAAHQDDGKPFVGLRDMLVRQFDDLFVGFFCHGLVDGYGLDRDVEHALLRTLEPYHNLSRKNTLKNEYAVAISPCGQYNALMPSIFPAQRNKRVLQKAAGDLFAKFLDAFYPRVCVYCGVNRGDNGPFLCNPCRDGIIFIENPFCHRCGFPAEISYAYPHEKFECGLCRKGNFAFDRARSVGIYDSALKQLVHHFKYRKQPGVMKEVVPLIETHFSASGETYQGFHVVPVPLHTDKLLERGFDQSYLIAKAVAEQMCLPLWDDLLTRIKPTESQTRKKKRERLKNMRDAFRLSQLADVAGKDILLVDDVFTTGATVNEATKVLKRAGAGHVYVFTLART